MTFSRTKNECQSTSTFPSKLSPQYHMPSSTCQLTCGLKRLKSNLTLHVKFYFVCVNWRAFILFLCKVLACQMSRTCKNFPKSTHVVQFAWGNKYTRLVDVCHHECKRGAHVGGGPSQALVWVGRYCLDSLIGGGAAGVGPASSLRSPKFPTWAKGTYSCFVGFWRTHIFKETIHFLIASYHKRTYNLSVWVPRVDPP